MGSFFQTFVKFTLDKSVGSLAVINLSVTKEKLTSTRLNGNLTTHFSVRSQTVKNPQSNMSGDAPALKDLPKIEGSLKDELVKPHDLKKTEVSEKSVLPSAEDLKQEKTHEGVLKGVEGFSKDNMTPVKTREPLSGVEVAKNELHRQKAADAVKEFDKTQLKHAETQEKNSLPDSENIKAESEHIKFKEGIERFEKEKLKDVETVEKNTLPTKEVIEQEKKA